MYLKQTMQRLAGLAVIVLSGGCEGSRQPALEPVMVPSFVGLSSRAALLEEVHGSAHAATVAPPGHTFQPRRHPPRVHSGPIARALDELPPMVVRRCGPEPAYQPRSFSSSPSVGKSSPHLGGSVRTAPKRSAASAAAPRSAPRDGAPAVRAEQESATATQGPQADRARPSSPQYRFAPTAPLEPGAPEKPTANPPYDGAYHAWGGRIYLSNDDTMSLSSAQRVIHAIENYLPLPAQHIRPHELLNYFSFETAAVQPGNDFGVLAELEAKPGKVHEHSLALSINGRSVTRDSRRNAALTIVLDRSGSMAAEGRMDYLRRGLSRMTRELKRADLLNVVVFNETSCAPLRNYVVGRDSPQVLDDLIRSLAPGGSTNLSAGLQHGYELAGQSHQAAYTNRVLLITDALTNTGVTDPEMISLVSERYDRQRIRLSGIGVGRQFNDHLLDRLTERGRGAYVFLGSDAEVDAVFGSRFTSLIETVANDVHFALHLPPSLRMNVFYGEESSAVKQEVQPVHYFAGTSQLFLSDLVSREPSARSQDSIMLSIEYHDPETGEAAVEEYAFALGDIQRRAVNVRKGRLLMSFIDGLSDLARRTPVRASHEPGGWIDREAHTQCQRGKLSLREQAAALPNDPEIGKVVSLWDRFCARYALARHPLPPPVPPVRPNKPHQRQQPSGADVWPNARL